jgi:NAD(P)-dependent dehydrogenase (short-subunit alcohol dehydrogenase family)
LTGIAPADLSSAELADLIGRHLTVPGAYVFVLDTCGGDADDPWDRWVTRPARRLLLDMRDQLRAGSPPRSITAIVRVRPPVPDVPSAVAAAALEAIRGAIGAAALELGPLGTRANVIAVADNATIPDIAGTAQYLADDSRSGYTTGATLHIGRPFTYPEPHQKDLDCPPPTDGSLLITGAAGGLGFAAAQVLADGPYDVLLSDLPGEALDTAGRTLAAPTMPCDVTDPAALTALVRDTSRSHSLSGLMILHGVGTSGAIRDIEDRALDRAFAVNGTAVHDLIGAFTPVLGRDRPAAIVVLSSQAGIQAEPNNATYCAAKFAVVGLVRGLAARLAQDNTRIHALCPGPVDTPLMRSAFATMAAAAGLTPRQYLEKRLAAIPLRTTGTPEQIGYAASYLLGLHGTGTVLAPTGGAVLT